MNKQALFGSFKRNQALSAASLLYLGKVVSWLVDGDASERIWLSLLGSQPHLLDFTV